MKLISYPSPNWNARPCEIDAIVLHATADGDTRASLDWCCTPKARNPNPVSYNSLIDRDGTVYTLVPVERRAWHAGYSLFQGRLNCNDFAIGLAFANLNDGHEPYPEVQLAIGAALVASYMPLFPRITMDRITTHAVVRTAWKAANPGRHDVEPKSDPAPPAFDLIGFKTRVARELAQRGVA